MKNKMKKWISASIIAFVCLNSYACDVCGCSINPGVGNVIPGVFTNYFGVRSSVRHFESTHLSLFGDASTVSKEWFSSTELQGRYSPHRRIQVYGFIPYNTVHKIEEDNLYKTNGLGDLRLQINTLLIDKSDSTKNSIFNMFLGGSIKLPTGRYEFIKDEVSYFHRTMLPGTGTFDYTISSDIIYRKKSLGTIASLGYTRRGENELMYRFGNVFYGQLSGFYQLKRTASSYLFEVGIVSTNVAADYDMRFNEKQVYTEGWMLSPMFKVSRFSEKWAIYISANKAAVQDLALAQVKQRFQLDIGITRFLN